MRIIAGRFKGRRLPSPQSRDVRPTTDRVREAIFSSLAAEIVGARVLDLFAGTGAFGLEALSRGAESAVFVENNIRAIKLLAQTIKTFGLEDRVSLMRSEAMNALRKLVDEKDRFGVIFMDPPYAENLIGKALAQNEIIDLLEDDGILIVEHDTRSQQIVVPHYFSRGLSRAYGRTKVEFLHFDSGLRQSP